MRDSDVISLYSGKLLELASDIPLCGKLEDAQGHAKRRSPVCGSSIEVGLRLEEGKISHFAQEVRACALGQASASILGRVILGRSPDEVMRARDALRAMLEVEGPVPEPPFEGYGVLVAARGYKNRYASIMLALEATCAAIAMAQAPR